jgi:hypothetical protein
MVHIAFMPGPDKVYVSYMFRPDWVKWVIPQKPIMLSR